MQPVRAVVSDNAGEGEGGEGRAQVGVCPAARALAQCTEPPPLPAGGCQGPPLDELSV